MHKHLLLLSIIVSIAFSTNAQTTPIPDTNFEQFLVDQGIDTNGITGDILNTDAQGVTALNVTRNDITDFTGLEAFLNVVTLNLGLNDFGTAPLTTLTSLEELTFDDNDILANLDLTQNINLRILNIGATGNGGTPPIPTLDLSQNLQLETIYIYAFTSLADILLPQTASLSLIQIIGSDEDIFDFTNHSGLEELTLNQNRETTNITLPSIKSVLKKLDIRNQTVSSVDLSGFIALEDINLGGTEVETLLLPGSPVLRRLTISGHRLPSVFSFASEPNLEILYVTGNNLPTTFDVDIASNNLLRDLDLSNNKMANLDMTQNTLLVDVDVSNNALTTFDTSQNVLLEDLNASRNNITTLDLAENTSLIDLNLTTNELPNLDVSTNVLLENLLLGQNQLPNLDITNNLELFRLNISENLFTTTGLDLTQNPRLDNLDASKNQIESLNISQNSRLGTLNLNNNLFTGTDIINQYHTIWSNQGALNASDRLDVSFNQLSGTIPDFATITVDRATNYFEFRFNDNNFEFGDFEAEHANYVAALTNTWSASPFLPFWRDYDYAPQAKVNTIENPIRNAGESITLTTTVRGEQNHYRWFKDGVEITDAPDSPDLVLTDLTTCDAGVYSTEVSSDLVPFENTNPPGTNGKNLLLVRNDITLSVNATKGCVTLSSPANTNVNVPINTGIQWNNNPGACGYKITVINVDTGTPIQYNGNPITDLDVGTITLFNFDTDLPTNTEISVQITPYFEDGDFSGCATESFTTNATAIATECTSLVNFPQNNETNVPAGVSSISWNPANAADSYKLTITSSSGTNNLPETNVGNTLSYSFGQPFQAGDVVEVSIIPTNDDFGDALSCTSQSFTIISGTTPTPTPPNCTSLLNPADMDTDMAIDLASISWSAVPNATQYRISINGSSSDLNDVTDLILSGTSHPFTNNFDNGETVTVTIVPLNGTVEPTVNCSTESFTIEPASPTNRPFITTWETTVANETISIPTRPFFGVYDYNIDWGDGTVNTNVAGDITHTYGTPGIHTVSITGSFPQIYFNGTAVDRDKILSIEQWGDIEWAALTQAFKGCGRLNITNASIDVPNLSLVTNLSEAFADATSFNGDITRWNVSTVINMSNLFQRASSFNQAIGDWDVSNVLSMSRIFEGATVFNQDIGNWDVDNVTSMGVMFAGATAFNQDISDWNVSQVIDMNTMFGYAINFNQDIGRWNVGNVENMNQMFLNAESFNQDISYKPGLGIPSGDAWNTSNVTSTIVMFMGATAFNQDIGNWNVGSVTNMNQMFRDAMNFDQNISNWDVSEVTDMNNMFGGVTLSTINYDALLIGWNAQTLQPNVRFSGGRSQYCEGTSARANIIGSDNWTISDGGTASPTLDDLADQNQADAYTLPIITGAQLTGAEAYFTGANGTGTQYGAGDIINYSDFPSYPITLYIYDGTGNCSSEESFELILTSASLTPPGCTTLLNPADRDANVVVGLAEISWNAVAEVTQYRISINGSSSDSNDVSDLLVTGTSHPFINNFENGETVTVTIVPLNGTLEPMIPCGPESFTIVSDALTPPSCTSLLNPSDTDMDVATDLTEISWNAVADATRYRININGSSSDSNDVSDLIVTGTSHPFINNFENGETVTVTIVPLNGTLEPTTTCDPESFTIVSDALTPPSCTSLTTPRDGEINVELDTAISWNEVANAAGYRLYVGTSENSFNIVDNLDVGILTTYSLTEELPQGVTIYVSIIPYNAQGDALACEIESFYTLSQDETLYGISPNGDGINDTWSIDGIETVPNNSVEIYNRWGDLVFKMEGYDNASNVFSGSANMKTGMGADQLPSGTYFFTIQVNGETILKKTQGFLVLKR